MVYTPVEGHKFDVRPMYYPKDGQIVEFEPDQKGYYHKMRGAPFVCIKHTNDYVISLDTEGKKWHWYKCHKKHRCVVVRFLPVSDATASPGCVKKEIEG